MKNIFRCVLALSVTAAIIAVSAGCNNPAASPKAEPKTKPFTMSGTFDNGNVSFTLAAADDGRYPRTVTAHDNVLAGVLTHGNDSRVLRGNYNPSNGTFAASTASDDYVYNLSGLIKHGKFAGAAAVVSEKGSGEWLPSIYAVIEQNTTTGTPDGMDGDVIPETLWGYWHVSVEPDESGGETEQDWFIGPRNMTIYQKITSNPDSDGVKAYSYSIFCMTVLDIENEGGGKYMITYSYPNYMANNAQLIEAAATFLGVSEDRFYSLPREAGEPSEETPLYPKTPWVFSYFDGPGMTGTNYYIGGLSPEQESKMNIFHSTSYYNTYASEHFPAEKVTLFGKVRLEYIDDNAFTAVHQWDKQSNINGIFESLHALNTADLEDDPDFGNGTR